MENIFLLFVILLLGIALFDLVVGVSNDAVNFLTSAIGSRAGTFRTIMIVASIGIFVGAASSGGLMEIAKRGIFNPSFFTFQDIIFIYVVVMSRFRSCSNCWAHRWPCHSSMYSMRISPFRCGWTI